MQELSKGAFGIRNDFSFLEILFPIIAFPDIIFRCIGMPTEFLESLGILFDWHWHSWEYIYVYSKNTLRK